MNVLLIDDHPAIRIGLQMIIEDNFDVSIIHTAQNGIEATEKLDLCKYDLIVLDIYLPDTDTTNLFSILKRRQPDAYITMYSNYLEEIYAMNFINMGANGYINKSTPEEELIFALKIILNGQIYLPKKIVEKNRKANTNIFDYTNPFDKISKRELELFKHLINGKTLKEIGGLMKIEQSTVATLKTRMMRKLGVSNLIELTKVAEEYQFV
ncbi:MAG: response regulator transcription factor [Flavobacteriaceae bacterium]|nr:response regulator transcription factor [Flavobacteriaceae bacterium]